MNKDNQPFTEHVTSQRTRNYSALLWVLVLMIAILGVVTFSLSSASKNARQSLESVRAELEKTAAELSESKKQKLMKEEELAALKRQLAELENERETVKQKAQSLEEEMRTALESKDVTISKLQGKLTVNILDRVMFDSGEAVLKSGGEVVMEKIASLLKEHPELKIHVIGHTDNIPIRSSAHNRFASNWELSTARALAALHHLTEESGIDPRRVGAVGYGEYRPTADNSTAEGRSRNRRIEIMILPDELTAVEAAPTPESVASKKNDC